MKKVAIGFALLALTAGSLTASAQRNDRDDRMAKMVERQAENLAKSLKLDDSQKSTFIELYKEYQDTLRAVRRDRGNEQQGDRKEKKELTDEEAEQLILSSFEQEAKATALKQAYYKKFREHFTANQLVSVFMPMRQQGGNRQGNNNQGGNPGGPMQGGPGAPGGFGGDW